MEVKLWIEFHQKELIGLSYQQKVLGNNIAVVGNIQLWGFPLFQEYGIAYQSMPIGMTPVSTFLNGYANDLGFTYQQISANGTKLSLDQPDKNYVSAYVIGISESDFAIYDWSYNDATFLQNVSRILDNSADKGKSNLKQLHGLQGDSDLLASVFPNGNLGFL